MTKLSTKRTFSLPKPCVSCKADFIPNAPAQLYCGIACSKDARRQRRNQQGRERYWKDHDRTLRVMRQNRNGKGRFVAKLATEKYLNSELGKRTRREYARRRYLADPVRAAYSRSLATARFYKFALPDLSLDAYRKMVASHETCNICGGGRGTRLCLDHCHETGVVRGMLCRACNTAIGLLNDDVERLKKVIRYLENAEIIETGPKESKTSENARRTQ